MKRLILLVIDSLGVGYMDDVAEVRPQDIGANTFKHILDNAVDFNIPTLELLGINNILNHPKLKKTTPVASYGTMNLQHQGADSYAGHQEIMGTYPKAPNIAPFKEYIQEVKNALEQRGYKTIIPDPTQPYIKVEDHIVIADNIETDYGQIYNLTAALDHISFEKVLEIANIVRQIVKVNRVIALGGEAITIKDIENSIETRKDGLTGVNSPKSGVYKKGYNVRHIGYGVNPNTQISTILTENNKEVTLIGKMQDVITCEKATKKPAVETQLVMELILKAMKTTKEGLIAATVQETDLAGHSQDPQKYAEIIMIIDKHLKTIIEKMTTQDTLIITADHGNDPTIGHSQHTREKTPLLLYNKNTKPQNLGTRKTLSDIAATIAHIFNTAPPEHGTPFQNH
ncbi:phosphopentomutase [Alkalicella caledoniensis]|uniref:Phosphopentomutase n=1 Tax=Alkalicella caledoniensis TaxID=2731377 RepID=A0A7G9W414_ALKCA|nr:phosphopentomutase [Alkalicella caledoniensis]QNO13426.1 phosphopentomutase [Alkalicella caledoniensis]